MNGMKNLRVLVVEDELLVALNMETQLENLGCEVVGPIARLAPAIAAAHDIIVDVAILDINLRDELVYPAAERLIERGIPIIFCSGYSDLQLMPDSFRDHPQVNKPYTPEELHSALTRALDGADKAPADG